MEAVGGLAGGIAHDFNNLLTAISGNSEVLLSKLGQDSESERYLGEIIKASSKAAALTRQLLAFGLRQVIRPKVIRLNDLLSDLAVVLRGLVSDEIELLLDLGDFPECVKADPRPLEQVVMNLVVNARDAMPKGGTLTVKTEIVVLEEDEFRDIRDSRPGRFVLMSVSDTGHGMDSDVVERIFDPFFTTKKAGSGTGLGLSTVYGIVKQHGGWINVDSALGQGTVFRAYLPVTEGVPESRPKEGTPLPVIEGEGERVLLVEDEEVVREFTENALTSSGYKVFAASTGNEAVELFRREKGDFALLLSDLVLPDKSGLELAESFHAENAELAVVLTTGFSDDEPKIAAVQKKGFMFLPKPYAFNDLLATLKQALLSK